jgi:hypothetical protein
MYIRSQALFRLRNHQSDEKGGCFGVFEFGGRDRKAFMKRKSKISQNVKH